MKKRLLGIAMLTMLLTGCSEVTYNLNINLNSFEEHLSFRYSNINDMEELVKENLDSSPQLVGKDIKYDVTSLSVNVDYMFNDILEIEDSVAIGMVYDDIKVTRNGNVTTVTMQGYNNSQFVCGEFDEGCYLVLDQVTFNLNSEYKIESTNADIRDEKNNKFTWILNSQIRDTLYFSYTDEIRWDIVIKNYIATNFSMLILIGSISIIVVLVLIFGIKFLKKYKESNN